MMVRATERGFEVYLTRRSARSGFMPDAYVFPGGTVDPADRTGFASEHLLGIVPGIAPEFAIAALRELFEEAGVLFACRRDGSSAGIPPESVRDMRRALAQGKSLPSLLAEDELYLDARELVYYSNWITPLTESRRFDTHFFVATPPGGQIAEADAVEVHDGAWMAPGEALERGDRGEILLMFPTREHLKRMAAYPTLDAFLLHARTRLPKIAPVMPRLRADGEPEFVPGTEAW